MSQHSSELEIWYVLMVLHCITDAFLPEIRAKSC